MARCMTTTLTLSSVCVYLSLPSSLSQSFLFLVLCSPLFHSHSFWFNSNCLDWHEMHLSVSPLASIFLALSIGTCPCLLLCWTEAHQRFEAVTSKQKKISNWRLLATSHIIKIERFYCKAACGQLSRIKVGTHFDRKCKDRKHPSKRVCYLCDVLLDKLFAVLQAICNIVSLF